MGQISVIISRNPGSDFSANQQPNLASSAAGLAGATILQVGLYEDLYLPISLPRRSAACRRYPATKIDESLRAFLKVRTETFDVLRLQLDVRLKNDIRGTACHRRSASQRPPAAD